MFACIGFYFCQKIVETLPFSLGKNYLYRMKKVAILGTGPVGQTLGAGFFTNGYEIIFDTKHPDKSIEWKEESLLKTDLKSYIEPLCILWCIPGFLHNEWTHAFRLLRK
ncbi:hypothetical protein A3A67_03665 [Candidatus Peribacteria bacterium RIFCSPLOWO2_01_FULL_51_18]|nr:MAG: hypothetical protein A3C52_02245 [Candidatus Peribacteria bacterium RIFCSPHIGHO2_02_FULL_51_15]OGJ65935.1 MAG: hypothetical protein A3A67_03665 [Candidatus Peribacteria bacterium RIFCSPLOWO2_01_FULL_51_18]OGJ68959.1 MAG: hypothetical protein A3J34_01785 [Candidatus Peribacteria bacterium RIFCSPLOWO2_02_FULL_51_10]